MRTSVILSIAAALAAVAVASSDEASARSRGGGGDRGPKVVNIRDHRAPKAVSVRDHRTPKVGTPSRPARVRGSSGSRRRGSLDTGRVPAPR